MLDHKLQHICWLGGSLSVDKPTLAQAVAGRCGCAVYSWDDAVFPEQNQDDACEHSLLSFLRAYSDDPVWLCPTDEEVNQTEPLDFARLAAALDELAELSSHRPILVAGTVLLPEIIAPMLPSPRHAIWVVHAGASRTRPRPDEHLAQLLTAYGVAQDDWQEWTARDAEYAQLLVRQASLAGLPYLEIDPNQEISVYARQIADRFLPVMQASITGKDQLER